MQSPAPQVFSQTTMQAAPASKSRHWTGLILTTLVVLFMLFDVTGKLLMPAPVVEAFQRLSFPASLGPAIGIILLASTIIYSIPRTSVLGAVLLTGFLGGAVAIQMRAGSPLFETVFPLIFGAMAWAGILLREDRLFAILPLRSMSKSS